MVRAARSTQRPEWLLPLLYLVLVQHALPYLDAFKSKPSTGPGFVEISGFDNHERNTKWCWCWCSVFELLRAQAKAKVPATSRSARATGLPHLAEEVQAPGEEPFMPYRKRGRNGDMTQKPMGRSAGSRRGAPWVVVAFLRIDFSLSSCIGCLLHSRGRRLNRSRGSGKERENNIYDFGSAESIYDQSYFVRKFCFSCLELNRPMKAGRLRVFCFGGRTTPN